jgi:LuxR family maltose regulon positive regulatory protein
LALRWPHGQRGGAGTVDLFLATTTLSTIIASTSLLNDIAVQPDLLMLVLDDYHLVDAQSVDEALAFLLDHAPPQLHLVLTTREDPNLPLARLRVRGLLTELRSADLRFTVAESAEFLRQAMRLDLTEAQTADLETHTEGWIAGLQMATLFMR